MTHDEEVALVVALKDMVQRIESLELAVYALAEDYEQRQAVAHGRRFDHLLTDDQRLAIAAVQQKMHERRSGH